jgi:hypothetical protein
VILIALSIPIADFAEHARELDPIRDVAEEPFLADIAVGFPCLLALLMLPELSCRGSPFATTFRPDIVVGRSIGRRAEAALRRRRWLGRILRRAPG